MADSISCIKFKWVIPQSTSSGELAQRSTEEGQHTDRKRFQEIKTHTTRPTKEYSSAHSNRRLHIQGHKGIDLTEQAV